MKSNKNSKRVAEEQHKKYAGRVIPLYYESAHIEREIEDHVQSIKSLINKLRPTDRQHYFSGLLTHILTTNINYPTGPIDISSEDLDYGTLSDQELTLLKELSSNIHRLYLEMDGL
jgi:hypothetical protein